MSNHAHGAKAVHQQDAVYKQISISTPLQKILIYTGLFLASAFATVSANAQIDHHHDHDHSHDAIVSLDVLKLNQFDGKSDGNAAQTTNPLLVNASFQQGRDRSSRSRSRRSDRSRSSRSSSNRSRSDRSRSDRSRGDRSRSDSSRSDRSRGDRSRGDSSRSDRSRGDSSRSDRSRGDSSRSDRSRGNSSRADRSRGSSVRSDRSRSRRSDRRSSGLHVRDRGYSRPGYYSSRRYNGRRYAHGFTSRRSHGYFCIQHSIFHYFTGFDPLGFVRISSYGRSSYRYPSSCYPVRKIDYYRGRKALLHAVLCYDAYDYPYIRRGSAYVVDYY